MKEWTLLKLVVFLNALLGDVSIVQNQDDFTISADKILWKKKKERK